MIIMIISASDGQIFRFRSIMAFNKSNQLDQDQYLSQLMDDIGAGRYGDIKRMVQGRVTWRKKTDIPKKRNIIMHNSPRIRNFQFKEF